MTATRPSPVAPHAIAPASLSPAPPTTRRPTGRPVACAPSSVTGAADRRVVLAALGVRPPAAPDARPRERPPALVERQERVLLAGHPEPERLDVGGARRLRQIEKNRRRGRPPLERVLLGRERLVL